MIKKVALFVLLSWSLIPFAQASAQPQCAADYAKIKETEDHYIQKSFQMNQTTFRTLDNYTELLDEEFPNLIRKLRENPQGHWIDAGGGMGIAAVESKFYGTGVIYSKRAGGEGYTKTNSKYGYYQLPGRAGPTGKHKITVVSYENMPAALEKDAWKDPSLWPHGEIPTAIYEIGPLLKKVKKSADYRYLHHRYFSEIPNEELGRANLITDVLGVFAYTSEKLATLIQYSELLKDDGVALITTSWDRAPVTANGKTQDLLDLLAKQNIPGLKITKSGIYGQIRLTPLPKGSVDQLKTLQQEIKLENIIGRGLPTFKYVQVPMPSQKSLNK